MKPYVWGIILLAICFTALTRNLKKWVLKDISSLSYFIITSCFTTLTALIYLFASNNLNNFVKDMHHLSLAKITLLILFAMLAVFVVIQIYNAMRISQLTSFSTIKSGAGLLLTILFAIVFLGERPTLIQWGAISLILGGISIFIFLDKEKKK